mmetsp:Transcript_3116/g.6750  ORF Transcript_3116/g.6750 Transcript_3116/m.6750 type:complete len:202 (-) Transcript_3116:273-878(-)
MKRHGDARGGGLEGRLLWHTSGWSTRRMSHSRRQSSVERASSWCASSGANAIDTSSSPPALTARGIVSHARSPCARRSYTRMELFAQPTATSDVGAAAIASGRSLELAVPPARNRTTRTWRAAAEQLPANSQTRSVASRDAVTKRGAVHAAAVMAAEWPAVLRESNAYMSPLGVAHSWFPSRQLHTIACGDAPNARRRRAR